MIKAQSIRVAGKNAIIAVLMGGSSLAYAEDAAPVIAPPPTTSPVAAEPSPAPAVTPPPVVSTLPSANDVVNAAAAQDAAAEASERRSTASTSRAALTERRVTRPAPAVPTPVVNAAPASAVTPTPVEAAEPLAPAIDPNVTAPVAVDLAVDEGAPAADTANAQNDTISGDDVTLIGGIAAALAAIGLGAAFAARRKRKVVADQPQMDAHRDFVAPAPIKQDPAFQQFAAKTAPVAPAIAAPIGQRTVQPKPVVTRPDVPVTDPLFSTKLVQTPITDPLFAPRNDIEIPITDPMFAHLSGYDGNSANSKSAWAYDNRQNRTTTGQANERALDEMEPAE